MYIKTERNQCQVEFLIRHFIPPPGSILNLKTAGFSNGFATASPIPYQRGKEMRHGYFHHPGFEDMPRYLNL